MIKAAKVFHEEKLRRRNLVATLVLTTNQLPSEDYTAKRTPLAQHKVLVTDAHFALMRRRLN